MSEQAEGVRTPAGGSRLGYESSGSRQVRATALGRGTHGVPDVRRMVESQFHVAFPHRVWVAGAVGRVDALPEGDPGLAFELHASTGDDAYSMPCFVPGDTVPTLRELLHRTHDADVEDVVREGRLARVGGLVRFDPARSSVVFVVSELDPTPTALGLEDARQEALHAVAGDGLADRQRTLGCRTAPLEVAVVGGAGGGALAQVQDLVAGSGFDVRLEQYPVALTGADAARLLAEAVGTAGRSSDVVLLVRDEGRPLTLSSFDALEVARAVADAPVPVLTGLGGAGAATASDEVAFMALPTAAAATQWVLSRLAEAGQRLVLLADEVELAAVAAGARCRQQLLERRDAVAGAEQQAAVRSTEARRRHRRGLRVGCALLAVLVVVAALVTGRPLLLVGLLLPAAVLAGTELSWRRARRTGGRTRMSQRDEDFTQVLQRLDGVRKELAGTSSPERVAALREQAAELFSQGEQLLRRHLQSPPARPVRAATTAQQPA